MKNIRREMVRRINERIEDDKRYIGVSFGFNHANITEDNAKEIEDLTVEYWNKLYELLEG